MKFAPLSIAGREIAQWRRFFHARAAGDGDSRPPHRADAGAGAGDTEFNPTQWSITEWSDTQAEALALTAPLDSTETAP
jgi:hypothetical protein